MLSYRHAFHAGNFADVLKHLILIQIINYLKQKDKPSCFIDTHAGAGRYALNSDYAEKNREFDTGIGKLWERTDLPQSVSDYVALIKQFNKAGRLNHYPGSPLIAQQLMRGQDRLFCYELHTTDIKLLRSALSADRRAKIFHADGLKDSLGLLPPLERRGLVLMDPSYELKSDYQEVIESLIAMTHRFANGTYALWYPVVNRRRNNEMEQKLKTSGIKNMHLFELGIRADSPEPGMTASGMIVINPPWTLAAQMEMVLPWLAETLGQPGEGFYRRQQLVAE